MSKKHRSPNDRDYSDTFVCNRCGESKPLARFTRNRKRDNYVIPICKDCFNERAREKRREKREAKERQINPSPGWRRCSACQQVKPVGAFYKSSSYFDSISRQCKECKGIRVAEKHRELKVRAIRYLGGKCHDCPRRYGDGKYHYAFFEFHHDPELGEKRMEVAKLIRERGDWHKVENELDKCILLCVECHRKRHCRLLDNGDVNPSYEGRK